MNTFFKFFVAAICCLSFQRSQAQVELPSVGVLNIDTKGLNFDSTQMGSLVRLELSKLGKFHVVNRYDLEYLLVNDSFKIQNCYSAACLLNAGKVLGVDKMLGGSVEVLGELISIQFRLLDIKSGKTERSITREYLKLRPEIKEMVTLTLQELFELPYSEELKTTLSKPFNFDKVQNNPYKNVIHAGGPRMGMTFFTGTTAARLQEPKNLGGYDVMPFMSQFGYQFEKIYLNEGRLQALFEFLPMVTGIDQQLFIPSITIMNGFRDNQKGWEIAFGPTVSWSAQREWFQTEDGILHPNQDKIEGQNFTSVYRLDIRGEATLSSSFIIAAGKTFKSGHLNIPVNIYMVPGKEGFRYGFSFGFNAKK